jgi:hypothetical protein
VVEKRVVKIPLGSKTDDLAYWRSQPYQVRLAALEEIRQEYNRWRYGAQPGLQRLCRIAKR